MRLSRKQLEDNYDSTVKRSDLYYVALAAIIQGKSTTFKKDGIHLIVVGLERANGGVIVDMTAGYPSPHYLDELNVKMQSPNGMDCWVAYRTLLDKILLARERIIDVKEFVGGR